MRKLLMVLMAIAAALFVASTLMIASMYRRSVSPPEAPAVQPGQIGVFSGDPAVPAPGLDALVLPTFSLMTHTGSTFTNDSFRGRVTIVDFIFTNCPFICPGLMQVMQGLQTNLSGTGVRLLSISVDPAHDTPEVLGAYAKKHACDTTRWTFAVGTPETTKALIAGGFKFVVEEDAKVTIDLANGAKMNNILHPSWLALIGPDGKVLQIAMSSNPDDVKGLEARARALDATLKK